MSRVLLTGNSDIVIYNFRFEFVEELKKQGLAWILLNVKVKILDNPTVNDDIYVSTWPSKPRLAEYIRSYDAIKNDKVIFEGLSRWVLVDIQNHKISRDRIEYKCETKLEKIDLDFDKIYLKTEENTTIEIKGRHDPCICPRITAVSESATAIVLADHMIRSGFIHPTNLEKIKK